MDILTIVLIALIFGIFIFSILTLLLSSNSKLIMKDRYKKYFKDADIDEVQDQVLKEKHNNTKINNGHKFQWASKEFSNYLAMSGVKLSATEYIYFWVISIFAPMLLVLLISKNVIPAVGIGIIGFAAPPILVQQSKKKRQGEFNKQLGESLTLMGNSIRAGFSFQQAMENIASEMQPPISTEFSRALREVQYGLSLEEALRHMVNRVKNKDLDLLVSSVLTSAQVGGNLSDILEVISETIKDRIKIKDEVRILTTSGRTSGLVIGLLPVIIVLILMVINPEYFQSFFESQIGKILLIISVILEATGFFVINKICDIKY